MQLAFDPRDRNQAVHVLALIEALHPDMAGISSVDAAALGALAADADAPDPATAFAGQSAEQAFAPPPPVAGVAPPAPPASPAPTTAGATTPTPPPAASPPATSGVETDKEGLPWDNRIHGSPAKINKSDGLWRAKKNLDASVREQVVAELRQAMAAPGAAPLSAAGGASPAPAPDATASTTAPPAPPPTPAPAATASGPVAATTAPSAPPPPVPVAPPAPPPHDPLAAAVADGWTPHPESAGWYYKGSDVKAEADVMALYPAPSAAPPPPPAAAPAAAPATDFAGLMRKITGMQTAGQLTVEQTAQISQSLGITGVRDLMHRPDLIPSFDAALPVVA